MGRMNGKNTSGTSATEKVVSIEEAVTDRYSLQWTWSCRWIWSDVQRSLKSLIDSQWLPLTCCGTPKHSQASDPLTWPLTPWVTRGWPPAGSRETVKSPLGFKLKTQTSIQPEVIKYSWKLREGAIDGGQSQHALLKTILPTPFLNLSVNNS